MDFVIRDCCDCCAYPFEDGEIPVLVDDKKVHVRCESRFRTERETPPETDPHLL